MVRAADGILRVREAPPASVRYPGRGAVAVGASDGNGLAASTFMLAATASLQYAPKTSRRSGNWHREHGDDSGIDPRGAHALQESCHNQNQNARVVPVTRQTPVVVRGPPIAACQESGGMSRQGSGLQRAKFRALYFSHTTRSPTRGTAADADQRLPRGHIGGRIRGGVLP
jgi:hypothetical protein